MQACTSPILHRPVLLTMQIYHAPSRHRVVGAGAVTKWSVCVCRMCHGWSVILYVNKVPCASRRHGFVTGRGFVLSRTEILPVVCFPRPPALVLPQCCPKGRRNGEGLKAPTWGTNTPTGSAAERPESHTTGVPPTPTVLRPPPPPGCALTPCKSQSPCSVSPVSGAT